MFMQGRSTEAAAGCCFACLCANGKNCELLPVTKAGASVLFTCLANREFGGQFILCLRAYNMITLHLFDLSYPLPSCTKKIRTVLL
jgi:hypothetical protein